MSIPISSFWRTPTTNHHLSASSRASLRKNPSPARASPRRPSRKRKRADPRTVVRKPRKRALSRRRRNPKKQSPRLRKRKNPQSHRAASPRRRIPKRSSLLPQSQAAAVSPRRRVPTLPHRKIRRTGPRTTENPKSPRENPRTAAAAASRKRSPRANLNCEAVPKRALFLSLPLSIQAVRPLALQLVLQRCHHRARNLVRHRLRPPWLPARLRPSRLH
jgi:hypothetical protein